MLVLDEPTAALDPVSERQLVESYQAVMRGRTSIVISHRAAVAEAADHVAVVDGARLVQTGTPRALLAARAARSRGSSARAARAPAYDGRLAGLAPGVVPTSRLPRRHRPRRPRRRHRQRRAPGHPHVGAVAAGASIAADGARGVDTVDRLGHGTAVSAAIRDKAPDVALVPVRVFHRELRATADALEAAIDWAVSAGVHVINLSLGTANPAHEARLAAALALATAAGVCLVAAEATGRHAVAARQPAAGRWRALDWTCPRDEARFTRGCRGRRHAHHVFARSGYPRPIPGVPPERNLKGVSFAVANATGLICLHLSSAQLHRGRQARHSGAQFRLASRSCLAVSHQ